MSEYDATDRDEPIRRRRFLAGSVVGLAGIAGCGGDSGDDDGSGPESTPDRTTAREATESRSATPMPTATATPSATPTPTSTPAPASFSLSVQTGGSVQEGEQVEVTVTVRNEGDETGSGTITLADATGTELDATEVTVEGNEETELMLTWETEYGDAGGNSFEVRLGDAAVSDTVIVTEGPGLSLVDSDTAENADGEAVLLTGTVENEAPVERSGVLVGRVEMNDESHANYREVTLAPDERADVLLKVTTNHGGEISVFSYDLSLSDDPPSDVDDPTDADYLVVIDTEGDSVSGESAIEVTAEVENLGEESRSATLGAQISSDAFEEPFSDTADVTVAPGQWESHSVTVEYETDESTFFYSHYAWVE